MISREEQTEAEDLARGGEENKSMRKRSMVQNGDSLEIIVIEILLENRFVWLDLCRVYTREKRQLS